MVKRVVLIGVGGASCSGKSTICEWLSELIPCRIIHQDRFYKPDSEIPVVRVNGTTYQNWDCPEAISMGNFVQHLQNIKINGAKESIIGENVPKIRETDLQESERHEINKLVHQLRSFLERRSIEVVVVDGFLLYCNTECINLIDIPVFMFAPDLILKERREKRAGYITIEGFWQDPPGYFENVVLPEYFRNNSLALEGTAHDLIRTDTSEKTIGDTLIFILRQLLSKVESLKQMS